MIFDHIRYCDHREPALLLNKIIKTDTCIPSSMSSVDALQINNVTANALSRRRTRFKIKNIPIHFDGTATGGAAFTFVDIDDINPTRHKR